MPEWSCVRVPMLRLTVAVEQHEYNSAKRTNAPRAVPRVRTPSASAPLFDPLRRS